MNEPVSAKDVFADALELPAGEREAFAHRACGADGGVLREVLELLRSHAGATGFLEPRETALHPDLEGPGTVIGRYRLLGMVGEGGFGTVYLAEQREPVVRHVALKIIKPGMDTAQVIARFEGERQALAMMDHPNIAKVLDAGATQRGRPYFVMEYVPGEAITAYGDRKRLTVRERLGLFLQVSSAVQHAHTKGVAHRDIKPSNVLVSEGGQGDVQVRVIDFGIAKATDPYGVERTAFTQTGQFLGTPAYMSPEQAAGDADIDTRTDVYALGVLLYELLTGTTPLDAQRLRTSAYGEVARLIREVDPPAPSTRLSQSAEGLEDAAARRGTDGRRLTMTIRGELDWIVMRAMEKDRTRRYQTANALAEDVQRYLNGSAVLAAPPSALYLTRKYVLRHRVGAIAGAAVAASLLAGLGAALWQGGVARRERDAARERGAEVEAVAAFQAEQLAGINPQAMGVRLREQVLASARDSMERLGMPPAQVLARQATLTELIADANMTTVALDALGTNVFDRAASAIDRNFGDRPLVRARLLQSLATTTRALGLLDRAIAPQTEAVAILRREAGSDDPRTLAALSRSVDLLTDLGRLDEAKAACDELLERQRRLLAPGHPDISGTLSQAGLVAALSGRFEEAETYFQDSLAIAQRALPDDHADLILAMNNMAMLRSQQRRHAEAEPFMRGALERSRRRLGDEHVETIRRVGNLGFILEQQGKSAEAEPYYREALEKRRRLLGDDHPQTILAINNMAWLEHELGHTEEVEPLYREAIERARRTIGERNERTLRFLTNLGLFLRDQRRAAEAEALYREALEGLLKQFDPGHARVGMCRAGLGGVLLDQGRDQEAREELSEAARILETAKATEVAEYAQCQKDLGTLQHRKASAVSPPAGESDPATGGDAATGSGNRR